METRILLIVILLCLSTFPISVSSDPIDGYLITSVEDYNILGVPLDKIEDPYIYTPTPFVHCHLPMIFSCNFAMSTAKDILSARQIGTKECEFEYRVLTNTTFQKQVPIYKDVPIIENKTMVGTSQELAGWENVSDYLWKWQPLKTLSITKNKYYIIDIYAKIPATINSWKIDVIPKLKVGAVEKEFNQYAWWDANWDYYVPFWIDSDYVDNNLNDFPLMVNITDSDILSNSLPNGDDIRFVLTDNVTTLFYENEYWSSSRYAIFYVNISELSSITNTEVLIYYGNAAAANGESTSTWHSRYKAVYHMNDTTAPVTDSTVNGDDSTGTNNNPGYYRLGNLWKAIEYSHTADAHIIPQIMTNAEVEANGFTHFCWFKIANLTADRVTLGLYNDLKSQIYVRLSGTYKYSIYIEDDPGGNNWADSTRTVSTGIWYHGVAVFDKANTDSHVYLQGKLEGTDAAVPSIETTGFTNTLGNTRTFGWGTMGIVDETRIYLGVLNLTYINVTYRAENDTSVLIIWGSEHGQPVAAKPYAYNFYPANGTSVCPNAVFLGLIPVDTDSKQINVTIRSNFSGTWRNLNLTRYVANNTTLTIWILNFTTFNKTWWWNASLYDGTNTEYTTPYYISTAKHPSNCSCEGGGGTTTTVYYGTAIGVVGLFGLFGWIMKRRKKKNVS